MGRTGALFRRCGSTDAPGLPRVLRSLPPELVDYKGLTRYRQTTIDWLSKFDDGAPTSPGIFPD